MTPKKGDHVEVEYLNYRMTGTVVGFRMAEDEDESLVLVALDTKRASTVMLMPYKIVGLTDEVLDGTQGPRLTNGNLLP